MTDLCLLPSACHDGIDTPNYIAFAAQYLACTPPCQRFACCLAAVSRASLGVSVVGYSFPVTDFHLLFFASFPAGDFSLADARNPCSALWMTNKPCFSSSDKSTCSRARPSVNDDGLNRRIVRQYGSVLRGLLWVARDVHGL